MTEFLPIAGIALLVVWFLETVFFLVSYRQSRSSRPSGAPSTTRS